MPRAKTTSKKSKLATSNSSSNISLLEKSDQANIDLLVSDVKGSNLTKIVNNNAAEKYIAGSGDNTVNITVSQERDDSALKDSNNNNAIKIHFGEAERLHMGILTVFLGRARKKNDTATAGNS
jgi:hypothetical protein